MKKSILFSLIAVVLVLSAFLAVGFQLKRSSAICQSSSIFATCQAVCEINYFHAEASTWSTNSFPICMCAEMTKMETKSIEADALQLKKMDAFIEFASGLEVSLQNELVANLKEIKMAIQTKDYNSYSIAVEGYSGILGQLSSDQKNLLNDWIAEQ